MAIIPSDEKVFMVDKRTNTVYGGSAALQAMQQWYTMQDVADSVQPYKVFTALLTQSGNDNPLHITSGTLTIGVTYLITNDKGIVGWDFTNVGAPNNEIGTYFIATGITPANWNNGSLDYNTGAPVATVLENTIGNVWFTYVGVGSYQIPFEACAAIGLTTSNSACFINNNSISNGITAVIFDDGDGPLVQIYTLLANEGPSDSILVNAPIEIRVYN